MRLVTGVSSSRIWIWIIALLVDIFILSLFLFPVSFTSSAGTIQSSSETTTQDIIDQILNNQEQDDSKKNNLLESIWDTFKKKIDNTRKNVLPSSSSSLDDSSIVRSQQRSQQQIIDDMTNRRVFLMEQSLNEHYTYQLLNSLPQLKEYNLHEENGEITMFSTNLENDSIPKIEQQSPSSSSSSSSKSGIRWKQIDTLAGETMCYCFSESTNSYWSFQWCPQQQTIYQGRREPNGTLQRQFNLGSGRYLPIIEGVQEKENGKILDNLGDAHRLTTSARSTYPEAQAIHPYVVGDLCVEGRSERRVSAIVFHESTSTKCSERKGKEMIIESVDEVRVCQYMIHICKSSTTFSDGDNNSINSLENDSSDDSRSITESGAKEINQTLHYIRNHVTGSYARKTRADSNSKSRESVLTSMQSALPPLPQTRIQANLKLIKEMFIHAYDSYMYHGYPASEVKPITCQPASFSLVKIPGLTLIDSLDTLVILGNYTEFARAVERLRHLNDNVNEATGFYSTGGGMFNLNHNVSVFETNIRVLGGLLSAHQLANAFLEEEVTEDEVWAEDESILSGVSRRKQGGACNRENVEKTLSSDCTATSSTLKCKQESLPKVACLNQTDKYWVYDGFLLELAQDIGDRLLPAFNTKTGIPYGTVNLIGGIPKDETTVASLAGGGTLSLEMELLGRLTGNKEYGRAAKLAARALWMRRSPRGLFGKHICTHRGEWHETLSGIGSNSDSFYEYLIKHHILFPEDDDFWPQLVAAYGGLHNESRQGEWYGDVDMKIGRSGHGAPRKVLEALMAFYPGMQTLLGEITPAARTLNSFFLVREYLGFLPERFHYGSWNVDSGGAKHLLRPELLESAYFLHRSSKGFQQQFRSGLNRSISDTSGWHWSGDFALHTIEKFARTECGYASLRDVSADTSGKMNADKKEVRLLNEMPSYFLSETLKYLYLLFDDKNILHTDEERDWIFTTEAHPIHHEQKDESIVDKLVKQKNELKLRIQRRLDRHTKPVKDIREGLLQEKWTEASQIGDFVNQLEPLINEGKKAYKTRREIEFDLSRRNNSFSNAIEPLLPHAYSWSIFDVFNERSQMLNPAYLTFQRLGNEATLTNSCSNLYASNFLWIRALNGGIADYSDTYKSRLNDDLMVPESDSIQLGSVDALALYGTGVHIKSFYEAFFQCPIQDIKKRIQKKTTKDKINDGPTRFEMEDMGSFDISAFPGGSGFFVQHIESGETLVTTLIENDATDDDRGPLVLVYSKADSIDQENESTATDDTPHSSSMPTSHNHRTVILADLQGNSFSCVVQIVETRIVNANDEELTCNSGINEDVTEDGSLSSASEKTEDKIVGQFPCSPALFGPTHISNLKKVKTLTIEAAIQVPGFDDEHGCGRFSFDLSSNGVPKKGISSDSASASSDFVVEEEEGDNASGYVCANEVISTVRRGDCTFQEKSLNQKNTKQATGVIVINNDEGDDLFVMSGGGSEDLSDLDTDYPVTVLVTWADGQRILEITNTFENNSHSQLNAKISLVHDEIVVSTTELTTDTEEVSVLTTESEEVLVSTTASEDTEEVPFERESSSAAAFWPRVRASPEALQIYSNSGWGIHAVQRYVKNDVSNIEELQWQLYLMKHDLGL